ncbi:hypothetical protein ACCW76_16205 [Pantoea sp. C8B4]|uniref:hypothetical protein n=1 Tax=Pantoea sp. C8B4 TaxID=3243083 RepID=UPI003EDA7077
MKRALLNYINHRLEQTTSEPMEQLVYISAKLSIIASPVAWGVKRMDSEDMLYLNKKGAERFLTNHGRKNDYLYPLYKNVKIAFD